MKAYEIAIAEYLKLKAEGKNPHGYLREILDEISLDHPELWNQVNA